MMNGMKQTKSESFDGQRDSLKMNICLYKMDAYFELLLIRNLQLQSNIQAIMKFAFHY